MIKIRPFETERDYEMLCEWWNKWPDWVAIPIEALPELGYIAMNDTTPVVAGFLYQTDSCIAWLEYIIGNPEADKTVRHDALGLLIEAAVLEATKLNYKSVFTSVKHPKLEHCLRQHNFIIGDTNVNQMVRSLKCQHSLQ